MILRNNVTGEYVQFPSDDDPRAQALMDLRESAHPTEGVWAQTGVEALEDAKAKGIQPSLVSLIPPTPAGTTWSDELLEIEQVDKATTIADVNYYPNDNITGVNTNSRTLTLSGSGSEAAALAFTEGVNATADEPVAFTVTDDTVAEGDTLAVSSAPVGTGIADPGGVVVITFAGNVAEDTEDFGDSDAGAIDE